MREGSAACRRLCDHRTLWFEAPLGGAERVRSAVTAVWSGHGPERISVRGHVGLIIMSIKS
jgi:hypothetical protein